MNISGRSALVMGIALVIAAGLYGCGKTADHAAHDHGTQPAANVAPEALTPGDTYACVMHPEVTSGTPGKCTKCGMALDPIPKADSATTDMANEPHRNDDKKDSPAGK